MLYPLSYGRLLMYRRDISPEVKGSLDDDGEGWRLVSALSAFVPARTSVSGYTVLSERGSREERWKVWIRGPGAGG
jgi:hypothetical protein